MQGEVVINQNLNYSLFSMFSSVNIQGLSTNGSRSYLARTSILVLLLSRLPSVFIFLHRCSLAVLPPRSFSFSKKVAAFLIRVTFLEITPRLLNLCLSMKICSSGVLLEVVREGLLPLSVFRCWWEERPLCSSAGCSFSLARALAFWSLLLRFSAKGTVIFCWILMARESLGSASCLSPCMYFMSHWNLVLMRVFLSWYLWLCLGMNCAGSSQYFLCIKQLTAVIHKNGQHHKLQLNSRRPTVADMQRSFYITLLTLLRTPLWVLDMEDFSEEKQLQQGKLVPVMLSSLLKCPVKVLLVFSRWRRLKCKCGCFDLRGD